jgi:hypothetical protein
MAQKRQLSRGCGAGTAAVCGVSQAHPVRSRLPEELWAAAAKLARRDGIDSYGAGAGCGSAESAEVDGSIRASRKPKPRKPRRQGVGWQKECRAPPSWNCWRQHGSGNQLSGGSRIAAGCEAAAGVEGHSTSALAELIRAFAAS